MRRVINIDFGWTGEPSMQKNLRTGFTIILTAALASAPLVAVASAQGSDAQKAATTTAPAPEAEPSVTILGSRQAQSVLGKEVRSSANENMGRIVDVIVDRSGKVRAAVIDFGGFLGVGSRKIAVEWNTLRFDIDSNKRDLITLELTRDQVKAAPEYKDKQSVVVLGAAGGLQSMPDW
jgi:hypothetical protein